MNKIKIIFVCLFIPFFVLLALAILKIKKSEEYHQKIVLAGEIHKVLGLLMFDLREAREDTIQDVPADGQWHNRLAFERRGQGALEYVIRQDHLFRINNGQELLIADDIGVLRIRRQKETPGILEVQIEAIKGASLVSNLKIRIRD